MANPTGWRASSSSVSSHSYNSGLDLSDDLVTFKVSMLSLQYHSGSTQVSHDSGAPAQLTDDISGSDLALGICIASS